MINRDILNVIDGWLLGRRFAPNWDRRTRVIAVIAAFVAGVWLAGGTP